MPPPARGASGALPDLPTLREAGYEVGITGYAGAS
jgi:tripartite-type tricarboxylate transporter receptor subunit TctC